jgi:CMP-N-acetylneuraminic acid synthetase
MSETVLGIIPARGGSKGIPGKNVRPLAGRSLLAYTAAAARASGVIDRLVLTTDSAEIASIRLAWADGALSSRAKSSTADKRLNGGMISIARILPEIELALK